jgi:UDP-3-O-[3-hydroxymyristoyl] glucosamine N-acyltransferase
MYKVDDIRYLLSSTDVVLGDKDHRFSKVADIANVDENTLDWIHSSNRDPLSYLRKSKAMFIIVPRSIEGQLDTDDLDKTIIISDNPMLLFSRIARKLFVLKPDPGINPSSVIHPEAKIGKDVYIGPLCYIGKCEIGDNCIIHSHVSIEVNVTIGNNVLIKNGARIGQPGFGFVKNESGDYEKFPQIGKVIIEDDVEIGANTCIDRGALSVTKIGRCTKIDNMVQVAHNVQIGEDCIITGNVSIGGSSRIGDNVWIGPCSTIRDGVQIGSGAFINMGAVVVKNVKAGQSVIGNPAEAKEIFALKRYELSKLYKKRRNT